MTPVTTCTESLRDVFIKNISTENVTSGDFSISDHILIYLLAKTAGKPKPQKIELKMKTQKITAQTLRAAIFSRIQNKNWEVVQRSESGDAAYEIFISNFKCIYHEYLTIYPKNSASRLCVTTQRKKKKTR